MRISQADHPSEVRLPSVLGRHGENAEIARPSMAQSMSFLSDQKSCGSQLVFHLSEDGFVTQGNQVSVSLGVGMARSFFRVTSWAPQWRSNPGAGLCTQVGGLR